MVGDRSWLEELIHLDNVNGFVVLVHNLPFR
jgi:hypothetical protein